MGEHTIVVLGKSDAGKTAVSYRPWFTEDVDSHGELQFIKAIQNAAGIRLDAPAAEEEPTLSIVEYEVTLSDGQSVTFVDTPGFDGFQPGGEPAKETEEILQMLEEHLGANGAVSHVLVFFNANGMDPTDFKPRAQRAFDRLFPNAQIASITTRWDQIEDDDGPPSSSKAEEAQSKEESLYASGRTGGSLLEYLLDGRQNQGGDLLRFRSGLSNESYSLPQDIVHKLFAGPGSDTTLEKRLSAVTKERDDLAAKYALLLEEKQAWTAGDCAPGPPDSEPVRTLTSRTRRQRLLATIKKFSGQVLEMVDELDRDADDAEDERTACRAEVEVASAAVKVAEGKLEEAKEDVKEAEEERTRLKQKQDWLTEQERGLTTKLNELETSAGRRSGRVLPVKQQIALELKQTQTSLKDTESFLSAVEDYYITGRQAVEQATAEVEKWKRVEQEKDKELNERLSESEQLLKERESFRPLQRSLSTNLDAMRDGLKDRWEGKLGSNIVFLEHLDGHAVGPEMVARGEDWAPTIESFYESQVELTLLQDMAKFHSAVLRWLKSQEDTVQREWEKGVEDIFGPPLINLPPPPPPLTGHTGDVNSAVFSWDGTKIVSGSDDQTVRVWDALTGEVQTVLEGHSAHVTSVAFSPDGKDIVSGSFDKTVRVWDVLEGKVKRVLEGHSDAVRSVDFSADGSRILSGSTDKTLRIWEASTGKVQRVLEGHTGYVYSAVFSGDGSRIFSGSHDHSVRVWDTLTGEARTVLNGHTSHVISVASSRDGLQVVSGACDNTVKVWDVLTGEVLRVLEGHSSYVYAVSFSRVGSRICSGSLDKTLRVWDPSTGRVQSVLTGHSDAIRGVAFSRDGRRILSASYDKTARVWDTPPLITSTQNTLN
ncbi:hypothetical protein D9611_002043 [Ephemerocybe angulata]|uniref:G domain-containing protein n=1 Tax=Ephemerocybe angulata TaxID=980116 RepID=A0A8H5CIW3_9AGAR|nr:hypothetical protein D9611_002043 [Tulosesus angulatus]